MATIAEITEAKQRVAQLEAEAREEQRRNDLAQLQQVQAERARLEREFNTLSHQIEAAKAGLQVKRENVARANEILEDHIANKPMEYDLVPHAPECMEWKRNYDRLVARRDALARDLQSFPDIMAALKMRDQIVNLRNVEANLVRRIRGEFERKRPEEFGELRFVR